MEGANMKEIGFVDIGDILVGHEQDLEAATGCTVVISEQGATVGVDVRGGAPSTRETDLLNPVNMVQKVHAVFLSGGSAFGLDSAAGIMQYLEERNIGFDVQVTKVPIVCGASLFDLVIGDHRVRPDRDMGYRACLNASRSERRQGNVGAGTGATVGKALGMDRAMKSGLGSFGLQLGDLKVGALVAVNCLGDVIDPLTGKRLAGTLNEDMQTLAGTEEVMEGSYSSKKNLFSGNTTIGIVATNAVFNKAEATKMASMAHNGFARAMRPAHSMYDGDTIFAMSTGSIEADLTIAGFLAARAVERAVVAAVVNAGPLCGLKCFAELNNPA